MLGSSRGPVPENAASPSTSSTGGTSAATKRRSPRYEVQERLGEGALWVVYRVRPAVKGTPSNSVALKALRGAANRHPRLPEALDAGAAQWHELSHPHLAPPLTWGVESGTSFFTSALLNGGSLHTRLAKSALGAEEAMQLLRSLASVLNFLHTHGLVHGDVRPRQVLFDASGFPVLTDGGHAGALALAGLALADLQPDSALYLAPERGAGQPMSPASDMYSLGVTFYQALTGHPPFEGASPLALAARHRHDTPSAPSTIAPNVPREWDALALRLLAKNPEARPSAYELERLLQPRSRSVATPATVAPTSAASVVTPISVPIPTPVPAPAPVPGPVPVPLEVAPSPGTSNGNGDVQATSASVATAPKRRPLDQIVEETMAAQSQVETEETRRQTLRRAKRRHSWREFGGMIGSIVCLLLLVGGGVGGALWGYNQVWEQIPKTVVVPDYLNKRQDVAKQILAKSGLYMRVTRESFDPKVPAGTVMEGDPIPGRDVRARREVFVTVSAGQAPIKMVDFSALTLDQARAIILQHGMRLGPIAEQYDDKSPRGAIIGQYPDPGDSFSRSQPITLVVSRGAQPRELDAQNGEFVQPDPLDDTNTSAPFDTGESFAPLEPASGGAVPGQGLPPVGATETKSATIKISIPQGDGTQLVRIIVRDAKGERTVYQKARPGGITFEKKVTVSRAPDQLALVRVFVGDKLIMEEQI